MSEPMSEPVAERVLLEYIDALDFMVTMWKRLVDMSATGDWEAHSELVARWAPGPPPQSLD